MSAFDNLINKINNLATDSLQIFAEYDDKFETSFKSYNETALEHKNKLLQFIKDAEQYSNPKPIRRGRPKNIEANTHEGTGTSSIISASTEKPKRMASQVASLMINKQVHQNNRDKMRRPSESEDLIASQKATAQEVILKIEKDITEEKLSTTEIMPPPSTPLKQRKIRQKEIKSEFESSDTESKSSRSVRSNLSNTKKDKYVNLRSDESIRSSGRKDKADSDLIILPDTPIPFVSITDTDSEDDLPLAIRFRVTEEEKNAKETIDINEHVDKLIEKDTLIEKKTENIDTSINEIKKSIGNNEKMEKSIKNLKRGRESNKENEKNEDKKRHKHERGWNSEDDDKRENKRTKKTIKKIVSKKSMDKVPFFDLQNINIYENTNLSKENIIIVPETPKLCDQTYRISHKSCPVLNESLTFRKSNVINSTFCEETTSNSTIIIQKNGTPHTVKDTDLQSENNFFNYTFAIDKKIDKTEKKSIQEIKNVEENKDEGNKRNKIDVGTKKHNDENREIEIEKYIEEKEDETNVEENNDEANKRDKKDIRTKKYNVENIEIEAEKLIEEKKEDGVRKNVEENKGEANKWDKKDIRIKKNNEEKLEIEIEEHIDDKKEDKKKKNKITEVMPCKIEVETHIDEENEVEARKNIEKMKINEIIPCKVLIEKDPIIEKIIAIDSNTVLKEAYKIANETITLSNKENWQKLEILTSSPLKDSKIKYIEKNPKQIIIKKSDASSNKEKLKNKNDKSKKDIKIKPIFNLYANSPVKKKVAAFEKLVDKNSDTNTRITRTKTRKMIEEKENLTSKIPSTIKPVSSKYGVPLSNKLKSPLFGKRPGLSNKQNMSAISTSSDSLGRSQSALKLTKYGGPNKLKSPLFGKRLGLSNKQNISAISTSSESLGRSQSALKLTRAELQERREEDRKKKMEKEDEVKRKKDAMIQAKIEESKRIREEKMKKAQNAREEKERQKEEKLRLFLAEKEDKLREESAKKKALLKQKAAEIEEQRRVVEQNRIAKQKEVEEQRRLMQYKKIKEKAKKKPPPMPTPDYYDTDSSDDSERPIVAIPRWNHRVHLFPVLCDMMHVPVHVLHTFFNVKPTTPNLEEIFKNIPKNYLRRNSSAVWKTPPRYSTLPKF